MPLPEFAAVSFSIPTHCMYCQLPFDQGQLVSQQSIPVNSKEANCLIIFHYHAICHLKDCVTAALNSKKNMSMEMHMEIMDLGMQLVNGLSDEGRKM